VHSDGSGVGSVPWHDDGPAVSVDSFSPRAFCDSPRGQASCVLVVVWLSCLIKPTAADRLLDRTAWFLALTLALGCCLGTFTVPHFLPQLHTTFHNLTLPTSLCTFHNFTLPHVNAISHFPQFGTSFCNFTLAHVRASTSHFPQLDTSFYNLTRPHVHAAFHTSTPPSTRPRHLPLLSTGHDLPLFHHAALIVLKYLTTGCGCDCCQVP
jgi:hypothetical protein